MQINYIDAIEEEDLKLSYWTYFVPTIYTIDTDGRAYILSTMNMVHDFDTWSKDFKSQKYKENSTLHFAVPPLITSAPPRIVQYIIKDVRRYYNKNLREQLEK